MSPVNLLAYVPVLHRGYLDFFRRNAEEGSILYLPLEEVFALFPHLTKDIRAVPVLVMARALRSAIYEPATITIDGETLTERCTQGSHWILPDEEEMHAIAERYMRNATVTFDPVFLRWDRQKILAQETVEGVRSVPFEGLAADMFALADEESRHAANWWRQVGAVIAREGIVLLSGHNTQVPHDRVAAYEGDARSFFSRGLHVDLTTDEHAEALLVAEAARRGEALEGADLYVTTFPCPPCAKLVATSGISRVYFFGGYAMLDGRRILEDAGIELVHVLSLQPA